jgi:hypothetical protein
LAGTCGSSQRVPYRAVLKEMVYAAIMKPDAK